MTFDPTVIESRLLYRDGLCLVIDKPAGLAVHGGVGEGPSLTDWLPHLRLGRSTLPQIAHRLDRNTTGCLVLGRHAKALRRLGDLFAAPGSVEKVYWAVVGGTLSEDEGTIDLALSEKNRQASVEVDPGGRPAVTRYRVLARQAESTLVELRPRTGRTHQLRVHMASLGHPIDGDLRYGGRSGRAMLLHARALSLPLYPKRPPLQIEAPLPQAWPDWVRA